MFQTVIVATGAAVLYGLLSFAMIICEEARFILNRSDKVKQKINKYIWRPNYRRSTTAHKAIGKVWTL